MTVEYYALSAKNSKKVKAKAKSEKYNAVEHQISVMEEFIKNLYAEANCYLAEKALGEIYNHQEQALHFIRKDNTEFIWIRSCTEFNEFYTTMNILIDKKTRILKFDLDGGVLSVPTFMDKLGQLLRIKETAVDVGEFRDAFMKEQIETLIILVSGANLLSTGCLHKMDHLLRAASGEICKVCWILDDITVLTRLPLPVQANLSVRKVEGRDINDLLLEIVEKLLGMELIPMTGYIEKLKSLLMNCSPPEILLFLKLSMHEHYSIVWDTQALISLASVRRELEGISDLDLCFNSSSDNQRLFENVMVKEIADALQVDASTTIKKLCWAWRILITLRGLFGEDSCPAHDLLNNLMSMESILPGWLEPKKSGTLARMIRDCHHDGMQEEEALLRKMQMFEKSLFKGPLSSSAQTKVLHTALSKRPTSDTVTFFQTISDSIAEYLDFKWSHGSSGAYETHLLKPGVSAVKLMNPKIMESLQMALEHPEFYLRGEFEKETPRNHLPDTSIVFHLAGECGKFINTLDWFNSFRQVVDPKKTNSEESSLLYTSSVWYLPINIFGVLDCDF